VVPWLLAGTYDSAEEAAMIYDAACRELRGHNTHMVNFPHLEGATATK
jgi:hypothetical protein